MPTRLQWDASFSVGNATLDNQHKKLFGVCNRLGDCIEDPGAPSDVFFHEILSDLARYAREHFTTEEAILSRCGYPQLDVQKIEHARYEFEIAELCLNAALGKLDKVETHQFLSNWLTEHVLGSDMQYCDYVRQPG